MRSVILHYHIYKNAGMSIEEILDHNFGERFCRLDTADQNGRISSTDLVAYLTTNAHVQALSSHQLHYPVPAVPGYFFFDLCFLRDPLDRIRSIYDYTRDKPVEGDPVSALAGRLNLRGFVTHLLSQMPRWCCDVQVGFLAGTPNHSGTLARSDLERALRTVLQTSFLGVVDRFEDSLAAGEFFLKPVFPGLHCAAAMVNTTRGLEGTVAERKRELRDACGHELYSELEARNALDLELVEFARTEVKRRVKLASL